MLFSSLYTNSFGEHSNLEKITERYPYFSVAHFFLLQQSNPSQENYERTAAKTALHFANPYLLNQQLNAGAIMEQAAPTPVAQEETIENKVVAKDAEVEEPGIVLAVPAAETTGTHTEHTRDNNDAPLLFEPLHTTDYFASQGIKMSEVVQPGDKIGRQLKSFTEWLKTMKKVHPEGLKEKNEGSIDPAVQKLAEKSNTEEEVITESMAEVYLQQGKTNKAKEIYEKLSLLNPSKNAYFAAKLNEIQ